MATYTKINAFCLALAEKKHNLTSDTLTIALTNTAHTSTWDRLSDLTQVSYANCSSRVITTTSSTQTSGTYKLVLADLTLTASGGDIGPFRYIYIYNDTSTDDLLVGYYDYGSSVTVTSGNSFLIDFSAVTGALTNA